MPQLYASIDNLAESLYMEFSLVQHIYEQSFDIIKVYIADRYAMNEGALLACVLVIFTFLQK